MVIARKGSGTSNRQKGNSRIWAKRDLDEAMGEKAAILEAEAVEAAMEGVEAEDTEEAAAEDMTEALIEATVETADMTEVRIETVDPHLLRKARKSTSQSTQSEKEETE